MASFYKLSVTCIAKATFHSLFTARHLHVLHYSSGGINWEVNK